MNRFVAASLLLLASSAAAQQELYVHTAVGRLYRIDNYATQPTAVHIGNATPLNGDRPSDMAIDPVTGDFYLTTRPGGMNSGSITYRVDRTTLAATQVGNFQLFTLNGLDFSSDGRLFGTGATVFSFVRIGLPSGSHYFLQNDFDSQTAGDVASNLDGKFLMTTALGDIESYDPVTGDTVNLGPHGLGPTALGLEIDTDGTIYIALALGDIYTYDLATGVATFVGATGLSIQGAAFRLPAGPPIGDTYGECSDAVPNTTGSPGRISVTGSTAAQDNALTLHASDVPPNTFGVFLASQFSSVFGGPGVPLGPSDGNYCLGGTPPGIFRGPGQIQRSDLSGQYSLQIDLTSLPANTGLSSVLPGNQLIFQGWFRDTGTEGSNYTNAVRVIFS